MSYDDGVMLQAVSDAWRRLAPRVTWRGVDTGWNALDLWILGELVHLVKPAVVVVAGGVGAGGLPWYLADCLDHNRRGKLLAGEAMGTERRRLLPEHRRIQWMDGDLLVEDFRTAQRLSNGGDPVLVVADPARHRDLPEVAGLVTIGSYLVVAGDVALEAGRFPLHGFLPDPGRDPMGLSSCAWLLRVPA